VGRRGLRRKLLTIGADADTETREARCEREAFARLFHELETPTVPGAGRANGASGAGNWPDFGARLKRIYGDKVVPESEAVISYARGAW
jgi:hypothetical protein